MRRMFAAVFYISYVLYNPINSGAVILDANNIDSILAENEFVFINFYADWCRFSNMLSPIWDEAADKINKAITQKGKVVVGKVDCDKESNLGTRFHITKYPTLKYVRNGVMAKREYRGQRSADAFLNFVKEHTAEQITEYTDLKDLDDMDGKKRYLIGYFNSKDEEDHEVFRKVAANLKDDCVFMAGFGEVVNRMHPPQQSIVAFRPNKARSNEDDETFQGDLKSYDAFNIWASDKCTPLVREITFENAEELTEEGLPFLILFHDPEDNESIKRYSDVVQRELLQDKQNVNFLVADGNTFAHPLHHLGKSKSDLPLLAIDSFRHMYLFPKFEDMEIPGKLKEFLQDLYSGKLHREFHYGPDTTTSEEPAPSADTDTKKDESEASPTAGQPIKLPGGDFDDSSRRKRDAGPPLSQFDKLKPNKNRYTFKHDEF